MISWVYLRLVLTQMGSNMPFIRWIMRCFSYLSLYANQWGSFKYISSYKRCKACFSLAPLFLLLVVEGINISLLEAKGNGGFKGLNIGGDFYITYLVC